MKKKEYEAAELKVTVYENLDVIAASGNSVEENEGEGVGEDIFA